MNNIYSKKILLLPLAVVFVAFLATAVSAAAPVFVTDKIPDIRANIPFTYQLNVTDENVSTVTFIAETNGWDTEKQFYSKLPKTFEGNRQETFRNSRILCCGKGR